MNISYLTFTTLYERVSLTEMAGSNVPSHIFRGYDLRGLVGRELNKETVELIARGYATFLKRRRINEAVVGHDNRLSSEDFKKTVIETLADSGLHVIDIGLSLSQIVYFSQYYYQSKGAVMITGSHNPKEFNGFKFATSFSETMVTEEINELREIVQGEEFVTAKRKGTIREKDIFPAYKADLQKRVKLHKGLRVVVDSCNSTTGVFMPTILREAGCEVVEQNTHLDGNFPNGVADPTEEAVQRRLARRVLKEGADIGFSYDADGDRIGIVDKKGVLIWNDTLVSIFAKDILDFLPGAKIVYNTFCSQQVEQVIRAAGGIPIIERTGHSFIKARVREERAAFGGELSGHFFFMDNFYGHDDGAFASLRLLSYLTRKKKSLAEVVAELPYYISSPEIKLGCPDEVKFKLVDGRIAEDLKKLYPKAKSITIDGIRLDMPDRMVIIRASQNGPYLGIKFEAKDQAGYDQLKKQIANILHKYEEIDFSWGANTAALG